jgi:hypothetical protein
MSNDNGCIFRAGCGESCTITRLWTTAYSAPTAAPDTQAAASGGASSSSAPPATKRATSACPAQRLNARQTTTEAEGPWEEGAQNEASRDDTRATDKVRLCAWPFTVHGRLSAGTSDCIVGRRALDPRGRGAQKRQNQGGALAQAVNQLSLAQLPLQAQPGARRHVRVEHNRSLAQGPHRSKDPSELSADMRQPGPPPGGGGSPLERQQLQKSAGMLRCWSPHRGARPELKHWPHAQLVLGSPHSLIQTHLHRWGCKESHELKSRATRSGRQEGRQPLGRVDRLVGTSVAEASSARLASACEGQRGVAPPGGTASENSCSSRLQGPVHGKTAVPEQRRHGRQRHSDRQTDVCTGQ